MTDVRIEHLEGKVQGALVRGRYTSETGVIVLSGSSGRVDVDRASLFAKAGAVALGLRWFGGTAQPPGICEVRLETFIDAIDYLMDCGCRRIVLVGTSKGAEAALLVATIDPRVNAVAALSPSSVVWGNIGPGIDGMSWPERSSWTYQKIPLDFVPTLPAWEKDYRGGLISYRSAFERCLSRDKLVTERARIPIEKTVADLVFVAGGDDALWPSELFSRDLMERCGDNNRQISFIFDPEAGHRILLPGETTPRSTLHAHGGSDEADAKLGRRAWLEIVRLL